MSTHANSVKRFIAYFSMEIALENAMPSYSGGLGVLAGDTIRAAADLRLPMVAVSLLYRRGYFSQHLSEDGSQTEEPVVWNVEDFLKEETARVSVPLENRRVEFAPGDTTLRVCADLRYRFIFWTPIFPPTRNGIATSLADFTAAIPTTGCAKKFC